MFPASLYTLCVVPKIRQSVGGPGQQEKQEQAAQGLQGTKGAKSSVSRGVRQTQLKSRSLFPSCVTLASPGSSLGLSFPICKWANRVAMRVKQVTHGAVSRTVCKGSAVRNGAHCACAVSPQKSVPSPSTSFLPCQAQPGLRKRIALALLFPQKKIPPGFNNLCCFLFPSLSFSLSLFLFSLSLSCNEIVKKIACSRAILMRLGGGKEVAAGDGRREGRVRLW